VLGVADGKQCGGENYTESSFTICIPQMLTMMIKSGKMGLSAGHVECLGYLGSSIITNDAKCTLEIESRIVMAKMVFNKKLDLNLRKKLV